MRRTAKPPIIRSVCRFAIPAGFECVALDHTHDVHLGQLPEPLVLDRAALDALWDLHPLEFHEVEMYGKRVRTPRWQQAYGADYHYTGNVNRALPVPALLAPQLAWAQREFGEALNGLLLNWYDGALGHYIGKHRDSVVNMVDDAPIVAASFGEERVFRLRPHGGKGRRDFVLGHGSVIVIPRATNDTWTHEVPRFVRHRGRRISLTFRAFRSSQLGARGEEARPR